MRRVWVIRSLVLACVSSAFVLVPASRGAAQALPVIEQIEPSSGPPGTVVNIVGRRFSSDAKVTLGTQPLPIVASLPNRVSVRIPEGALSGNVAVTVASGTVRGPEFRITPPPPAPAVDVIEPLKGPPGSTVVIRGKNFSAMLTGNTVTFQGRPVVVRAATPDELQVTVPEALGSGTFVVRVQQAGEATSKASFEVTAATSISALQPGRGGPGSELTIVGRGFSKVAKQNRVYLNNLPLEVKTASDNQLVVQLPAKVASGKVLVDVQGAGRAYSTEPFVVQRPPSVLDFAPDRGAPGSVITVRGTNFGTDAAVVEAKLGESKLLVREARDTSLRLEVQEGAASDKISIRVHGVGPAWSKQPFVVLAVLKLASFTPQSGPAGSEVVVEGQGFSPTLAQNRVSIGGQAAHVLEASATRLKFRIPKAKSGPIQIAVAGNAEVRTTAPFVIVVPPHVTSVSPDTGPAGCELTIRGSGFGNNPAAVKVTVAGQALEVKSVRDDAIAAKLGAGAKTGRVRVEVPLQGAAESNQDFVVIGEPPVPPVAAAPPMATPPAAVAQPAAPQPKKR